MHGHNNLVQRASQEPIDDGDGKTPLFPFGHGLSYAGTVETPGRPGPPVASAVTAASATPTWTAPTTGSAPTGYRDSTLLSTVAGLSCQLTGRRRRVDRVQRLLQRREPTPDVVHAQRGGLHTRHVGRPAPVPSGRRWT